LKKLTDILAGISIKEIIGEREKQLAKICFDSRQVEQNTLFVATKGTQADGHRYIAKAVQLGANVIICEEMPQEKQPQVTYIQVDNSKQALGVAAANFFGNPSRKLKLVGVTGTNGKTSIASLLHRLFLNLGYKVGLFSTIRNYINTNELKATHTTPNAVILNATLREMLQAGCQYCFMEVSSHAIDQERVAGIEFAGGIFTNLTHDHLDYHQTFAAYLKAKKTFFDNLPKNAFALSNADDKNGHVMLQNTRANKQFYSLKSVSDFRCKLLESDMTGNLLLIDNQEVWTKLPGEFNAYNLLAVYAAAVLLGEDLQQVLVEISQLVTVAGRFEAFYSQDGKVAIIDYAHTPDALKNILSGIQATRKAGAQIITVVGAGGDRDKSKRPAMAQIAMQLSERVILTSDNPRSENPEQIIADMELGIAAADKNRLLKITNRAEAIKTACMLAQAGDIVLVAGKGHESYQEIKGIRHHFDDAEIIKALFQTK